MEEKEAIRKALEALRKAQAELEAVLGEENEQQSWWDTRCRVLVEVYKKNGVVTHSEWKEIGDRFEYDRRGLGGFFTGNSPTMTQISGGRHALTERGRKDVEEYLVDHPELKED